MRRGSPQASHFPCLSALQEHQSELKSENFMITKGLAPFSGAKVFVIMEIIRSTHRQTWLALPAPPAR